MPRISQRASAIFESPFRKYLPLAAGAKARGVDVIHLNIGQPDFRMPEIDFATLDFKDYVPYGHAEGEAALRQAWCRYNRRFDIHLDPEHLLITTGASEGILFALLAVADVGGEVIVPEPFYANYNGFAQMAGLEIKPIFSSITKGFAIPVKEEFEQEIGPSTKAILLSNPNNPSGKVYSKETLEDLASLARKHELFLIVDEAYSEFLYEGFDFYSALRLEDVDDNVIVVDSVSKRFNGCGIRVGAIASRNEEIIEHIARFGRLRLSPPMLGQKIALAALSLDRDYHQPVVKEFASRRDLLLSRLSQLPDVIFHAPEGAFYMLVRLPIQDSEHFCAWLLTDFQYEGKTVMLSPGTGFYATAQKGTDEVRIAYILGKERLSPAMDCLEKALQVYPGLKKTVSPAASTQP